MIRTACIIQGSIRRGFDEVLPAMDRLFPTVIVSTWKSEASKVPPGDHHVVLSDPPAHSGLSNRNFQRAGMVAGLAEARRLGCTHVLRWRTDLLPTRLDVGELLARAALEPVSGISSRIVMSAWRNLSVDPDWFSTLPDLFMFSDLETMERLWSLDGVDLTQPVNFPPEMVSELGIEWDFDANLLHCGGKDYNLAQAYDAHVEFYAWLKCRLQRVLGRALTHPEIARDALSLIDHRKLGICWFKDTSALEFRSIYNAIHFPWWTERDWADGRRPRIQPMGYVLPEHRLGFLWNRLNGLALRAERRFQRQCYDDYHARIKVGPAAFTRRPLLAVNHLALWGGGEFALRDLLAGLRVSGRLVELMCFAPGPLVGDLAVRGVPVQVVSFGAEFVSFPQRPTLRDYLRLLAGAFKLPGTILNVGLHLWRRRPSVVLSNSPKSLVITRLWTFVLGLPHVHFLHDNLSRGYGPRPLAWLVIWLMRSADAVLCASNPTRASLVAHQAQRSRTVVVHQGLEFPLLTQPRTPAHGRRFVVGTVSRINVVKNLSQIIEAVALLRHRGIEVELLIAGETLTEADRGYEAALKSRIVALGLVDAVRFLGFRSDVWGTLAGFDVFVTTSRNEGLGRTVLEAMGMGLPVVVTPVGGLASSVSDGITGCWTRLDDSEHLAAVLTDLMTDSARRAALGSAAADWVRRRYDARAYPATVARVLDRVTTPTPCV